MTSQGNRSRRRDSGDSREREGRRRASSEAREPLGRHSSPERRKLDASSGEKPRRTYERHRVGRVADEAAEEVEAPSKRERTSQDRPRRSEGGSHSSKRGHHSSEGRHSSEERRSSEGRRSTGGRHRRVVDNVPSDTDNVKPVSPRKASDPRFNPKLQSGRRKLTVDSYYKDVRRKLPVGPIIVFVCLALIGVFAANMGGAPKTSVELGLVEQGVVEQEAQESSAAEGSEAVASSDSPDGSEGATEAILAPSAMDMSKLPESTGLEAFSLGGTASSISPATEKAITKALEPFDQNEIPVGFVFANLETGRGYSYNVDEEVYGASSIKGPFVAYICEDLVDGGNVKLSSGYTSYDENFHSNGTASLESLFRTTIEQSSNGSLMALYRQFSGNSYDSWLESLGVEPSIYADDSFFAWYTPRDAAKLWANIHDYLGTNTSTSNMLYGMMRNTNLSYIRNGIESLAESMEEGETEISVSKSASRLIRTMADKAQGQGQHGIENATVVNKAGWCASDAGEGTKYDSVSDNGIVTIDNEDYLLCIMSGARYTETNEKRVENLAAAIVSGYGDLQ